MAFDPLLEARLDRVARRQRRLRAWAVAGSCWAAGALLGFALIWIERRSGWASSLALPVIALLGIGTALVTAIRVRKMPVDIRRLALSIEARFQELDGRLITAVQQQPSEGGEFNYLQERIVGEALAHDRKQDWTDIIPDSRINLACMGHWLA